MAPEERLILQRLGTVSLSNLADYTTFLLLQGMFIGTLTVFTLLVIHRGIAYRPTKILFTTSIAALLFGVLGLAASIIINTLYIKRLLIDSDGVLNDDLIAEADTAMVLPELLLMLSNQILLLINDSIVIWRAWVLYPGQRLVMILPLLLLVGTFGTSLAFLIIEANPSLNIKTHNGGDTMVILLSNISVFLSLATNALATALILFKFWMHRRFIGRLFIRRKSSSSAMQAVLVLIESGIFFCIVQVITIICVYIPIQSTKTYDTINGVASGTLFGSAGMYPLVVVLLINEKKSEIETSGFSIVSSRERAGHNLEIPLRNVERAVRDEGVQEVMRETS